MSGLDLPANVHRHLQPGGYRKALHRQERHHRVGPAERPGDPPFLDHQGIELQRILTDRGTEYCRKPEHHAYQSYLAVEDIDHSRTKADHSQTNGICERFHKTLQDECYSLPFRKKLHRTLEELQIDLDACPEHYNRERPIRAGIVTGSPPGRPSRPADGSRWKRT